MKDEQIAVTFRGGKREGAGRKKMGLSKKVTITLPEEEWEEISEMIKNGHAGSLSEYFRLIHKGSWINKQVEKSLDIITSLEGCKI
jgi:hypothetical protein